MVVKPGLRQSQNKIAYWFSREGYLEKFTDQHKTMMEHGGQKTKEELEKLIRKIKYRKIYKFAKITLGSTRNQNGYNKTCQKIN